MPPGRGVAAGVIATAAVALGACTTSGSGAHSPAPSATAASTPAPSSAPATVPVSTPAAAPPSPSASAPAPAGTHTPGAGAARSTCTSVTVRAIQAGASPGQEIESLQFTNSGPTRCVLNGFPVVTLLRNGSQIGQVSQPSAQVISSLSLAPGGVAESILHDYTQTCQAPLSDSLRVSVPGMSTVAVRPGQLRACIVRVDRLGPPQ